jgi:hypothetical protein
MKENVTYVRRGTKNNNVMLKLQVMKWIWTYPVGCVYGWELLLGEVVCKSRGVVAKSNNLLFGDQ